MRADLYEEYIGLVAEYKAVGWRIYDDTADLNRAIAMCDAYYGDRSSITHLVQEEGKPVMIQNSENVLNDYNEHLRFIDFFDDGDNIWFSALHTNGLFRFDKLSGKTHLVCDLPAETLHESYRALCIKDNRLYIAPVFADNIAVYNIAENKTERSISLSERYMPPYTFPKFSCVHILGKYIFFIPMCFGAIVRLNTETNNIEYFNDFAELLLSIVKNRHNIFFGHSCVVDDKIYMPLRNADALLEFDMISCTSTVYKIGKGNFSYGTICYDGNNFWIMENSKNILVVWNKQNGIIDKIDLSFTGKFHCVFPFKNKICHIPCSGDLICNFIDKADRKSIVKRRMQTEKNNYTTSGIFKENSAAFCVKAEGDNIFVYSTQDEALCIFDETGRCLKKYVFKVCGDDYKRFADMQSKCLAAFMKKHNKQAFIEDELGVSLLRFLKYLILILNQNNIKN